MNIVGQRINTKRFQYWPPWQCTFWYRPTLGWGGDEFGNRTLMIGLAIFGTLVFWKPFGELRNHDDGMSPEDRKDLAEQCAADGWPEPTFCDCGWPENDDWSQCGSPDEESSCHCDKEKE